MAREAASRTGSFRLERVGAGVIVELRVAPAPGLGKSLAVPRDEVDMMASMKPEKVDHPVSLRGSLSVSRG